MSNTTPKIVLGVTHSRSLNMLLALCERLVVEGWDVHVVSASGPETSAYQRLPVTLHEISMAREPALLSDLRALASWVRLLRKLSPDIVLSGTPKAGFLGIVSAWIARVPQRIYHLRGLRMESMTGLRRKVLMFLEGIVFLLSTETLAVSSSLRQLVAGLNLVPVNKVVVLGEGSSNGVDTVRYKPVCPASIDKCLAKKTELGIDPDIPVIGFVGRISKDKGSRELVMASQLLHQRGLDHQLIIIGAEDEEGIRESIGSRLDHRRPVFTGRVADTAPYYHLMDVFCLPTHREGFPNVVLEAGSSGIATVTTDATGAVDSVIDGVTGVIVGVGDSLGMANALEDLLKDQVKRESLGAAARSHILENFRREDVLNDIVKFLQQRIASHSL